MKLLQFLEVWAAKCLVNGKRPVNVMCTFIHSPGYYKLKDSKEDTVHALIQPLEILDVVVTRRHTLTAHISAERVIEMLQREAERKQKWSTCTH